MSQLPDFSHALRSCPVGTFPTPVWNLLLAVEAAWAEAEGGIPSENEARRWSKVCDNAVSLVEFGVEAGAA